MTEKPREGYNSLLTFCPLLSVIGKLSPAGLLATPLYQLALSVNNALSMCSKTALNFFRFRRVRDAVLTFGGKINT